MYFGWRNGLQHLASRAMQHDKCLEYRSQNDVYILKLKFVLHWLNSTSLLLPARLFGHAGLFLFLFIICKPRLAMQAMILHLFLSNIDRLSGQHTVTLSSATIALFVARFSITQPKVSLVCFPHLHAPNRIRHKLTGIDLFLWHSLSSAKARQIRILCIYICTYILTSTASYDRP